MAQRLPGQEREPAITPASRPVCGERFALKTSAPQLPAGEKSQTPGAAPALVVALHSWGV